MKTFSRIVLVALALALVGGGAFLVTWNPKPPIAPVEKILPDDRFPR